MDTAKSTLGRRTITKGNKPWWSNSLHRLKKRVQQLKRKFRRTRNKDDFDNYRAKSQ